MARDTSPLDPQRRSLHAILRLHLASFLLAHALPKFVKDELEGYLDCGRLCCGCAVYECKGCGLARVTALSCKGRGFCPRCLGRRMAEGSANMPVDSAPLHARLATDFENSCARCDCSTPDVPATGIVFTATGIFAP